MIRLFVALALCMPCLAQTPADAEQRDRERWNLRFTDETYHFTKDANRFLQQVTAGLQPGLAPPILAGFSRSLAQNSRTCPLPSPGYRRPGEC